MATSQGTIDYLLDQLAELGSRVRARKMFGEYALYCDDKVVGLVCDEQLFIKINDAAAEWAGAAPLAPPYPGAKPYWLISQDEWDDRERLVALVAQTADILPAPQPRRG